VTFWHLACTGVHHTLSQRKQVWKACRGSCMADNVQDTSRWLTRTQLHTRHAKIFVLFRQALR
jgi:hypothetical protein